MGIDFLEAITGIEETLEMEFMERVEVDLTSLIGELTDAVLDLWCEEKNAHADWIRIVVEKEILTTVIDNFAEVSCADRDAITRETVIASLGLD